MVELERELASNKEYLQSTIEELEASNEELQSANEELQSSNEELQSTNEELETSKEELQSTNEELATVNDELHNRMAQLSVANDDLQNVLAQQRQRHRHRRRRLPHPTLLGGGREAAQPDPGGHRPSGRLPAQRHQRARYRACRRRRHRLGRGREQRVRCLDGSWYLLKLVPYVTADQMIRGLVLEFVKTNPPAATTDNDPLHPAAASVLALMPQPLVLINPQLHLVWANRAFFETFAVGPGSLGRPFAEAWGSPSEPPELWIYLEELIAEKSPRDIMIEHPFGRSTEQPVRLTGRVVPREGERAALAMVSLVAV